MPGNSAHDYEVREAINHVVGASRKLLDTDERPVRRDQHPKQHGCVRARFVVDKDLGDQLRHGLFQYERVYDAWIRFSNGAQRDDRKPDAHGMAIKLMGVPGQKVLPAERDATTQDFVLVDNPTFFLRDALAYARFSDLMLKAKGTEPSSVYSILGLIFRGPLRSLLTLLLLSLFPWRLPTFLRLIRFAGKRIANPLSTRYWSTTPYKYGELCMKFSAVPAEFPGGAPAEGPGDLSYNSQADFLRTAVAAPTATSRPQADSPDCLRGELVRSLEVRGAVFLFQVQLFQDNLTTPIEDPRVEWPADAAPFHTVARIWIPEQKFDTPGRMSFGENLSFTPWHAIPAHEPLGEINLVRQEVYSKLSELRHGLNKVPPAEPSPSDPDPVDSPPNWGVDSSAFHNVLRGELELIRERRRSTGEASSAGSDGRPAAALAGGSPFASRDVDSLTREARLQALNEHTTGLALAGDGNRGAAFAVGFMQGLASLGLIGRFDYLSAVSGGGYAAAWLAAWIKREGGMKNVEHQLASSRIDQALATRSYLATGEVVDDEPQPLRHLRFITSSLFPRAGIPATDTWTRGLSWARNVLTNLLVVLPIVVLVVAGVRLILKLYGLFDRLDQLDQLAAQLDSRLGAPLSATAVFTLGVMLLTAALALVLAFSSIARSLRRLRGADSRLPGEHEPSDPDGPVNHRIVTLLFAAALLLSCCLPPVCKRAGELVGNLQSGPSSAGLFSLHTVVDLALAHLTLLGWPNFLAHATVIGGLLAWWASRSAQHVEGARRKRFIAASVAAGVAGGVLLVLLEGLAHWFAQLGRLDLEATFVPPIAVLSAVAAFVVEVAVLGQAASDRERAWWSRLFALLTRRATLWIVGMATVLYLPGVIYAGGSMAGTVGAAAWMGAAVFGVLAGRYWPRRPGRFPARWQLRLSSGAALVFFVGLVGATALFVSLLVNMPSLTAPAGDDLGPFAYYLRGVEGSSVVTLLVVTAGFGLLYALARRAIDVNLFALSALDADRLTACYVDASRRVSAWRWRWAPPRDQRVPVGAPALSNLADEPGHPRENGEPARGAVASDPLDLCDLKIGRSGDQDRVYWGPHLLFNTTLEWAGQGESDGSGLAGESFLLSPLYCGSRSLGYARTESSRPAGGSEPNLSLGRVAAISGANSLARVGLSASRPLTALLTLFSARPGCWIERPRPVGWSAASPRFGDLPVAASFGLTGGGGDFVPISGSGQIDGLAVYELIRRRCRYIVAVDAGDDDDVSDAYLANLIRRCRIDFGLRIEIDARALHQEGPDGFSRSHVAIGKVHYGDIDAGAISGTFVYIRSSMTGDEPPDVVQHVRNEINAPHQPATFRAGLEDPWFECYRAWGEHIARAVFGGATHRLAEQLATPAQQPHTEYVPQLFAAVNSREG
jgi:hypothetical protein